MARRVALMMAVGAVVVLLGLVVATTLDPASGTGTNFQAADDVAAVVVGAHHAKPVPASAVSQLAIVLLAATIGVAVAMTTPTMPSRLERRRTLDGPSPHEHLAAAICGWRVLRHLIDPARSPSG